MKKYCPGASIRSDYAYICDCCEIDDGRPTLIWEELPDREGYFVLCMECLKNLFFDNNDMGIDKTLDIKRQAIPEYLRNRIFDRDGNKCLVCGTTTNLTVDHIIPFSKGGRTEESNLQTYCKSCNSSKRDK